MMKINKANFDLIIYRIFKHRKTTISVIVVLIFMFALPVVTVIGKYIYQHNTEHQDTKSGNTHIVDNYNTNY